jgi:hypothetical protein
MAAVDAFMEGWEKNVRAQVARDPVDRTLLGKYPLVLLHSRAKYAGGGYHRSTHSFLYATTDAKKHFNDVQLQFDNGGQAGNGFTINMVTNQRNRIVDLGPVDFAKEPDLRKIDELGAGPKVWSAGPCPATAGHVYVERVEDTNGNWFHVVFKVVAVKTDQYTAFFWRQLPGGRVVQRLPRVLVG